MNSELEESLLAEKYQFSHEFLLIVHPEKCTGCRICELACAYHFERKFSRKTCSIRVKRNEEKGQFVPFIYREAQNNIKACNFCNGEEQPLCIKYCPVEAIVQKGYGEKT